MTTDIAKMAFALACHLQAAGHHAYWVGGCVRDIILGREPSDYDIATSARPDEIEALFPHCVPVGRQFGVVMVVVKGYSFQVATFRTETQYTDGRHPGQIAYASAREDARRRDFTINGLFYNPIANTVYDWVGGYKDLLRRIIRTIGPPEQRFAEDHLRILRAARFAAQLNFTIEPATLRAVREFGPAIQKVSAERIRDELMKIFHPTCAAKGLYWLEHCGLLDIVLPEVAALHGCAQDPAYHPEGDVLQHVRRMLQLVPPDADPLLPWAVLFHDIGKPPCQQVDAQGRRHFYHHERVGAEMTDAICRRLRFTNEQRLTLTQCVRSHMKYHQARKMRRNTLLRLLLQPTAPLELELHRLDCASSYRDMSNYKFLAATLRELKNQPALARPILSGKDLLALGMKPGPLIGQLLKEVRDKQLHGELNTRREAIEWARTQWQRISQTPPPSKTTSSGTSPDNQAE